MQPRAGRARAKACRIAVLAALLAEGGPARGAPPGLGPDFPPGTPTRAAIAGWERVDGDVETATAHVVYEFYVQPERMGLYAITRYRVTRKATDAAGHVQRAPESEKYIWNVGRGQPLRCYARSAAGGWRALVHGTDEYLGEMRTAMLVYGLHRQVVLSR